MDYMTLGKFRAASGLAHLPRMHELFGHTDQGKAVDAGRGARTAIRRALELGINYFDTASMYSGGDSELVLGRALRDFARREEVVIATKGFYPMRGDAKGGGLCSRKAIMTEIDASLRRLGMDYVDLYQIHRWDDQTPIEETMEALHDVVKAGKARYIGASSMMAWQFAKALYTADLHGWTRFVSMQPHYNLLYREEEREMLPLCRDQGIGVLPWSPLARGRLARPWENEPSTVRGSSDPWGDGVYGEQGGGQGGGGSRRRGRRAAACRAGGPGVVAAQVRGHRNDRWCDQAATHLEEAVAALAVRLREAEIETLEAPTCRMLLPVSTDQTHASESKHVPKSVLALATAIRSLPIFRISRTHFRSHQGVHR